MASSVLIKTARLVLRTVTLEDVDAVASNWKLDERPISLQEAKERISWMLRNHEQNAPGILVHLCLAIIHRDTQELIGWCGLDHIDPRKENPVLFYLLKTNHWGKGLATEAAGAVIDYAFNELNLSRIDSATAYENVASKRVMEKIGMRYLGLDHEGGHLFSLTRDEYCRRKQDNPL
jgi:ribosomal-protein-alanine N-acetyltransferase